MTTILLRRNFTRPSKVSARPETTLPRAEKAVEKMPRIMLTRCWKIEATPWKMEKMAEKMEPMKEVMASIREAIFAVFCGLVFWFSRC